MIVQVVIVLSNAFKYVQIFSKFTMIVTNPNSGKICTDILYILTLLQLGTQPMTLSSITKLILVHNVQLL